MMGLIYTVVGMVVVWGAVMAVLGIVEIIFLQWVVGMIQAVRANIAARRLNPAKNPHRIWFHPIKWVKFGWWCCWQDGDLYVTTANGVQYPIPFSPFKRAGWLYDDDDD